MRSLTWLACAVKAGLAEQDITSSSGIVTLAAPDGDLTRRRLPRPATRCFRRPKPKSKARCGEPIRSKRAHHSSQSRQPLSFDKIEQFKRGAGWLLAPLLTCGDCRPADV